MEGCADENSPPLSSILKHNHPIPKLMNYFTFILVARATQIVAGGELWDVLPPSRPVRTLVLACPGGMGYGCSCCRGSSDECGSERGRESRIQRWRRVHVGIAVDISVGVSVGPKNCPAPQPEMERLHAM
jgi:hypothetical protein